MSVIQKSHQHFYERCSCRIRIFRPQRPPSLQHSTDSNNCVPGARSVPAVEPYHSTMAGCTIQEGDTVIMDCSDGRKLFAKVKTGR